MKSRDQILAAAKVLKREELLVPEWDDVVFVRGMTAAERQRHLNVLRERDGKPLPLDLYAQVVVWCVVDGDGKQVFNPDDAKQLAELSGLAVERIYKVVERLSFLGREGIEEAKKN